MNYLTADELAELKALVDHLNAGPYGELDFEVTVGDANGEVVGIIKKGDGHYRFYLLGTE
jgi:hypothetical protein